MTSTGAVAGRTESFVPGRAKWWQWAAILSLDAPAVSLAWQAMFAKVAGARLAGHYFVLLGLSVWLAYSADRWIEGWRLTVETVRTQRHYFFLRWRWPAFYVWLVVLGCGVGLAFARFTVREWTASLALLAVTMVYLLSHQLIHRESLWRVPKELCVAVIIALGAALYPAASDGVRMAALSGPVIMLFLLGLANCLLISDWEREVDARHRQTSLALQFTQVRHLARWLPAGIAILGAAQALTARGAVRQAAWCGTASAVLLTVISHNQRRMGWERARVLADAALLTPLVVIVLT